MCQSDSSPYVGTKCCSYYPVLPNFLVGGVLEAGDSEGARRVRRVLDAGTGVSPYGLLRPLDRLPRKRVLPTRAQLEAEICHYYDDGACSIWEYRGHMCATHHCLSVGGQRGHVFWHELGQYLSGVETRLALFAMTSAGIPRETGQPTPFDDNGAVDTAWMAWDDYAHPPERFYRDCFRAVADLPDDAFEPRDGPDVPDREQKLLATLRTFEDSEIPEELIFDGQSKPADDPRFVVFVGDAGETRLPALMSPFVRMFDGRRTTHMVVREATRLGVNICTYVPALRRAGVLRTP